MNLKIRALWFILGAALAPFSCRAEQPAFDVDALPHKIIQLPNGSTAEVVNYADHNWRVVEPEILKAIFERDEDVCFEAKFERVVGIDKIKLSGVPMPPGRDALVTVDDKLKKRAAAEFKLNDNIWLCGTLRRGRDGKNMDFLVLHMQKLMEDEKRYLTRIQVLNNSGNGEALLELGHKIDSQIKSEKGFGTYAALESLRDKAYDYGLTIKEKSVKPGDADALFSSAMQWKELRNKRAKYRDLVVKALQIDPDHPKASRVAQDELAMLKFRGRWMTPVERDLIMDQENKEAQRRSEADKVEIAKKMRERQEAVDKRWDYLSAAMIKLRSDDPAARQRAIAELAEQARKSTDPGFGEETVEVMANLDDPATIVPGMELLGKSEHPEVRQRIYETLVWRIRQNPKAGEVFAAILKSESNLPTAKAGIEASVSLGGKAAADLLINSLDTADRSIQQEIIEGLKLVTQQQLNTKEAWTEWWGKNKDSIN